MKKNCKYIDSEKEKERKSILEKFDLYNFEFKNFREIAILEKWERLKIGCLKLLFEIEIDSLIEIVENEEKEYSASNKIFTMLSKRSCKSKNKVKQPSQFQIGCNNNENTAAHYYGITSFMPSWMFDR